MFLRRMGAKSSIASLIYQHFPPHSIYLENFFGSGGMLFNKTPICKHNIVNDVDGEVINCFNIAVGKFDELLDIVDYFPYSQDLFKSFKMDEIPKDNVFRALRFIIMNNFTFLGTGNTLTIRCENGREVLKQKLKEFLKSDFCKNTKFLNCDFRDFISKISFRSEKEKNKAFLYSDPPYLDTENTYGENMSVLEWKQKDFIDLVESNISSGIKFAISEFDHPFIIETANKFNLNIIFIVNRRNLNNHRNEILLTNYKYNDLNDYLKNL